MSNKRVRAAIGKSTVREGYETLTRISYAEAALIAGVSAHQIQNWCSQGLLHRYPCGAFRIDAGELQRLLHGRIPIRKVRRRASKKESIQ